MNDLIEVILDQLKSIHPRVYQNDAEDDADFPYIVFKVDTGINTEKRHDDILIIEVWDENQDTTFIEDLTDKVERKLDYECINTDKLSTLFYKEYRKNTEKESKEDLECRELRFETQTYYFEEV